jgi:hypothetical protein
MITIKDHHTRRLFDPWEYVGPKRRKLLARSWSGVFRRYLLEELPVHTVARYFDEVMGRPSKELYTAIGCLILQQLHDLSDSEVTRALAFNLDWHYALDITDESDASTYLSERTLRTYRKILEEEGLDGILFKTLTDKLLKEFGVDTPKQRLDSTLIRSNMRKLGRIRIFATTIRKFLKKLKRTYPEVFASLIDAQVTERYLAEGPAGCFSRVKPSESSKTLQELGEDLLHLIELFSSDESVRKLPEYKLLERVLHEQCRVTGSGADAKVVLKQPKDVSPGSLQNPSDPDAGYDSHKGQGYKAQVMETYQTEKHDVNKPDLITHIEVEPAHKHDANALQPAIDNTRERNCCPEELTCDTLYGGDDNICEAADKGVEVIAPLQGPAPTHAISLSDFECDESTSFVTRCPAGHIPDHVCRTRTNRIRARFTRKTCAACNRLKHCPVKLSKKAGFLRYDDKIFRLSQRRAYEHTKEFKDRYRWRAGSEGTNSHLKSDLGAGRLRVRGIASVRYAVVLKALGLNILRCARALYAHLYRYLTQIQNSYKAGILDTTICNALFYILVSKNRWCLDSKL